MCLPASPCSPPSAAYPALTFWMTPATAPCRMTWPGAGRPCRPGDPAGPDEQDGLDGLDGPLVHRAMELLRAIEEGARSRSPANLDLLTAYERLERLGRPLNAVASVVGAPDRAEGGPLAGRPVAIQDIIAVAGVPTRGGSAGSAAA